MVQTSDPLATAFRVLKGFSRLKQQTSAADSPMKEQHSGRNSMLQPLTAASRASLSHVAKFAARSAVAVIWPTATRPFTCRQGQSRVSHGQSRWHDRWSGWGPVGIPSFRPNPRSSWGPVGIPSIRPKPGPRPDTAAQSRFIQR